MGFGGNLVQGFRVYARRAVPSFPQTALCALEMQPGPSPYIVYTDLSRIFRVQHLELTSEQNFKTLSNASGPVYVYILIRSMHNKSNI